MTHLSGQERADYVQGMFARIAKRYDLMNRLMTVGQDVRWRRYVIKRAKLPANGRLLDIATGTGEIALEGAHQEPYDSIGWGGFYIGDDAGGQKNAGTPADSMGWSRHLSITIWKQHFRCSDIWFSSCEML